MTEKEIQAYMQNYVKDLRYDYVVASSAALLELIEHARQLSSNDIIDAMKEVVSREGLTNRQYEIVKDILSSAIMKSITQTRRDNSIIINGDITIESSQRL